MDPVIGERPYYDNYDPFGENDSGRIVCYSSYHGNKIINLPLKIV